jgi:hypothetical protein
MPKAPARHSNFALSLDGVDCGFVQSAKGGGVSADVVTRRGLDGFDEKHLGALHFEEIELQVDIPPHLAVHEWLSDMLQGRATRRAGSVFGLAGSGAAASRRDFFAALLTQVTFPALDASSRETGLMTLKFAPDYTRTTGADRPRPDDGPRNQWRTSSFRLRIAGLDCTKVHRVGAFSISQVIDTGASGEGREGEVTQPRLVFPDLFVTLAESSARTWLDWHDDFLVKGNNSSTNERQGTLTFLSTDMKLPLA